MAVALATTTHTPDQKVEIKLCQYWLLQTYFTVILTNMVDNTVLSADWIFSILIVQKYTLVLERPLN